MKIWCLFSTDNEYDQPPNCLRFFWFKKPTEEMLFDAINELEGFVSEKKFIDACCSKKVFSYMYDYGTEYWLEEVEENKNFN